MANKPIPEMIVDSACETGENPLWHPNEHVLYWVDIPAGLLHRYDPSSGMHKLVYDAKRPVGGFTLEADGSLLLFMDRGALGRLRDGQFDMLAGEIALARRSRFNDVIADPEGRVFAGVMETDQETGKLLRIEKGKEPVLVMDGLTIPNGMGFTPDLKQLYFTDSNQRRIYLFDYDRATGDLSNRRIWLQLADDGSVPDGMAVDLNGDVWSARWDGSVLFRYSPDAAELQRIAFPANRVSSIAFGGPGYGMAYVTTAGGDNRAKHGEKAGALFQIDLSVRGRPEFRSRLGA